MAKIFILILATFITQISGLWIHFGADRDHKHDKPQDNKHNSLKGGHMHLVRYLMRDRAGQTWVDIGREGIVPKDLWVKGGPVKVLIHGYSPKTTVSDPMDIIRDHNILDMGLAYGKLNSTYNVIVLDWTVYAVEPTHRYSEAVSNVGKIGRDLAERLMQLNANGNLDNWSQLHLVGFQLGAHVAGIAGWIVKNNKTETKIGRITGLDPMGPEFDDGKKLFNETAALCKMDADFVDIIHCNMGTSRSFADAQFKGRYGSSIQAGHADFYPNAGEQQRQCGSIDESPERACSQKQCSLFFTRSIYTKVVACPCDDWQYHQAGRCECTVDNGGVYLGEDCDPKARGRYYLKSPST